MRQRCPLFPSLFHIVLEFLARSIRQEKRIHIGNEEVKLSLFANDIIFLKDLENSTKKLLDIINTFSKVTGYKISSLFIYQQ
jgi:hypothetical protein